MATIGITGGTGFIGQHLTGLLVEKGYEVVIFTRDVARKQSQKNVTFVHWNSDIGECDINGLRSIDGIVHLAGAGIGNKRWTDDRKKKIVDSRVKVTDFLVSRLKEFSSGCKTFVAASAIGYYGPDKGPGPFTENAQPHNDFLGDTCRQWEAASEKAREFARTVTLRFGIVLGKESGAFPKLAKPMSFGIMPVLGTGKQVVSWIEVDDLARLILYSIENPSIEGTYNAVTPNPVTHGELMNTIASEKGGIKIPVAAPAFVLKTILGEMGDEVLKSCTVSAQKTLNTGFTFKHPEIKSAVKAILNAG
jgi:uncharacterized protein (TIGR01777 family)